MECAQPSSSRHTQACLWMLSCALLSQVAEMVGIVWWTSQRAGDAECGYNTTALEALVSHRPCPVLLLLLLLLLPSSTRFLTCVLPSHSILCFPPPAHHHLFPCVDIPTHAPFLMWTHTVPYPSLCGAAQEPVR